MLDQKRINLINEAIKNSPSYTNLLLGISSFEGCYNFSVGPRNSYGRTSGDFPTSVDRIKNLCCLLEEEFDSKIRLDILGVKIDFEHTKERSAHARLLHDSFGDDPIPFIFKECTKVPRLLKEIKNEALSIFRTAVTEEAKGFKVRFNVYESSITLCDGRQRREFSRFISRINTKFGLGLTPSYRWSYTFTSAKDPLAQTRQTIQLAKKLGVDVSALEEEISYY